VLFNGGRGGAADAARISQAAGLVRRLPAAAGRAVPRPLRDVRSTEDQPNHQRSEVALRHAAPVGD